MRKFIPAVLCALLLACSAPEVPVGEVDTSERVDTDEMKVRCPKDRVGFTHSAAGIDAVVAHARACEAQTLERNRERLGLDDQTAFVAAISPHDDYVYAQRVYVHVYPYIKARHVILIGVAHRARERPECEGRLILDAFDAWHGPYGPVPISPLRTDLLRALPAEDVLVDDELHAGEHSLEAMVPFLLHEDREVCILPILVPYMSWERLAQLAQKTASALDGILTRRGLALGKDVALLISSDSVHYGDEGWGGRSYAVFGCDGAGYDRAVARDKGLIANHLGGAISLEGIEAFYRALVKEDFHQYRISWCGRFSIPFGLATLIDLAALRDRKAPRGDLLRYGTTLDPGRSDPGAEGLGITAPATLHHWVGFASIGYRCE